MIDAMAGEPTAPICEQSAQTMATARDFSEIGLCRGCRYPLRGLPQHRCPECGQPFDPYDPRTMKMAHKLAAIARWMLRPLGWPIPALTIVLLLLTLYLFSSRPAYSDPLFPALPLPFMLLVFLGAAWFVRLVGRITVAIRWERPPSELRREWLRWTMAPTVAVVVIALLSVDAPLRLRFAFSRPAMERFADELLAAHQSLDTRAYYQQFGTLSEPRRVGLYRVHMSGRASELRHGRVRLSLSGNRAFVYSPTSPPPDSRGRPPPCTMCTFTHHTRLNDNWSATVWSVFDL